MRGCSVVRLALPERDAVEKTGKGTSHTSATVAARERRHCPLWHGLRQLSHMTGALCPVFGPRRGVLRCCLKTATRRSLRGVYVCRLMGGSLSKGTPSAAAPKPVQVTKLSNGLQVASSDANGSVRATECCARATHALARLIAALP